MENQENKPIELTDYDYREMREIAYARYNDLMNARDERHKREAAWDTKHHLGPIARWIFKKVRGFHDWLDEDEIQEALAMANPMAGFTLYKDMQRRQEERERQSKTDRKNIK